MNPRIKWEAHVVQLALDYALEPAIPIVLDVLEAEATHLGALDAHLGVQRDVAAAVVVADPAQAAVAVGTAWADVSRDAMEDVEVVEAVVQEVVRAVLMLPADVVVDVVEHEA